MKKITAFMLLSFCLASAAYAENEKIDPETYICAELTVANVESIPPVFQILQIDGFASGKKGQTIADSNYLFDMIMEVSESCDADPTGKVLEHWQNVQKKYPASQESKWRADKTLCKAYNDNPDDASGFIIWLDGYWRGKNGKTASIFVNQQTLDKFLAACKNNPEQLILDALGEIAR